MMRASAAEDLAESWECRDSHGPVTQSTARDADQTEGDSESFTLLYAHHMPWTPYSSRRPTRLAALEAYAVAPGSGVSPLLGPGRVLVLSPVVAQK